MHEAGKDRPLPEKTAVTAVHVCDRLARGQFDTVMSIDTHNRFLYFLQLLSGGNAHEGRAEIIIQFYLSETKEELAAIGTLHWVGILFEVSFDQTKADLVNTGMVLPQENQDMIAISRFNTTAAFTMSWQEVAWEQFDWNQDVH